MMLHCPHCGHHLPRPLLDGITSCSNCRRISDSSKLNKLLSAAWLVRKKNIEDADYLVYHYGLSTADAEFVIKFVVEECLSHEEFYHLVKDSDIAKTKERRLDRAS